VVGGLAVLASFTTPALAAPCAKHRGDARAACLEHRAEQAWPTKPTAREIRKRVGDYNWHKARRVAVCETGMRLDWYPHGRYRGPLGMYRTTQDYGKRATGYWTPRTWQEHVAIAVAAHPITRGWSGWGCGGA
jgi:hypothetical protein